MEIPIAGKDMGMKNGITASEDSLAVAYKAKCSPTVQSRNRIPMYLPNWFKIHVHKQTKKQTNLHVNVYSSFIHNFPKFKATKIIQLEMF